MAIKVILLPLPERSERREDAARIIQDRPSLGSASKAVSGRVTQPARIEHALSIRTHNAQPNHSSTNALRRLRQGFFKTGVVSHREPVECATELTTRGNRRPQPPFKGDALDKDALVINITTSTPPPPPLITPPRARRLGSKRLEGDIQDQFQTGKVDELNVAGGARGGRQAAFAAVRLWQFKIPLVYSPPTHRHYQFELRCSAHKPARVF